MLEKNINELAKQTVKIIIQIIEYLMKNESIVNAKMDIGIVDDYCTLEINVLERNFAFCLNLIEKEYDYLIYKYLFRELFEMTSLSSDIMLSPLCRTSYLINKINDENTGIRLVNIYGDSLKLNFYCMTNKGRYVFNVQGDLYNKNIEDIKGRLLIFDDIKESYMETECYNSNSKVLLKSNE